MKQQELRPIPGWPDHRAGSDGRIYSSRMSRGREFRPLRPGLGSSGYEHVVMCWDGGQKPQMVHILIATAFHGPRPDGLEVAHRNGNKLDNRPSNLTWKTHSENMQDKVEHGTDDKGLKNTRACVDGKHLEAIRRRIEEGGTNRGIAKEFGISATTISRIRNGRRFQND